MTAEILLRPRKLTLQDLPFLTDFGTISNDLVHFGRSAKKYRLKTPVSVEIPKLLNLGHVDLVRYALSLLSTKPRLLPFVLNNHSLVETATYLLRLHSQSPMSLYAYTNAVWQYCERIARSPDEIILDVKGEAGLPDPKRIEEHRRSLKAFLDEMQERKLSRGYIRGFRNRLRTFYSQNAIELPRIPLQIPRATYKDVAPQHVEVATLLDHATLRLKAAIGMLCTSGMREGTLVRLKYYHIQEDYERGISPIHIHVGDEITKGQYHDYDTFIGPEAIEVVRRYLEARKKGGILHRHIGPEDITADSPLIRDEMHDDTRGTIHAKPQHIGEKQLYKLIHDVISKAGLLKPVKPGHSHYTLRVHTLRKFFKTTAVTEGRMPDSIAEYMMGRSPDTYNDIQSKGVEFLRSEYVKANIRIRPKAEETAFETLARLARQLSQDPDKVLNKTAFSEPHRIVVDQSGAEKQYANIILEKLKELAGKS